MATGGWWCCCSGGCPTFTETWDIPGTLAGSNDLAEYFVVVSGSWHIESYYVEGVGWFGWADCETGNGLAVCVSDFGFRAVYVTVETTGEYVTGRAGDEKNVNGTWRIVLGYADADNYVFAQWTRTSSTTGTVAVGKKVAGVETVSDSMDTVYPQTDTLASRTIYVYYTKAGLFCYTSGSIGQAAWDPGLTPGVLAGRVGIMGIGDSPNESRRFDNFHIYEVYETSNLSGKSGVDVLCVGTPCACDQDDISTARHPYPGDKLVTIVNTAGICVNLEGVMVGTLTRTAAVKWEGTIDLGSGPLPTTLTCGDHWNNWTLAVGSQSCFPSSGVPDSGSCQPLALVFRGFRGDIASPPTCGCTISGLGGSYDLEVTEAP